MQEEENMDEEIEYWITKRLRKESKRAKKKVEKEKMAKKERKRKRRKQMAQREAAYANKRNI